MPLVASLSLVAVLAAVLAVLVVTYRRQAAAARAAEVRCAALTARADAARAALERLATPTEGAPRSADGSPGRLRSDPPDARRQDTRRRPHLSRPPRPVSDPLPPARP